MARKLRIYLEDATYHTVSRCIEKKALMHHNKVKDLMIYVLNITLEKYDFDLIEYVIMDNHFHFCIKIKRNGENISRIMQFIKSQFARRYNRMMNRTGPFWNERFSDTIIELNRDPRTLFFLIFEYIGFNPVRCCYVNDPREYKYSSYRCYIDENYNSPVKITLHEYFLELGNTFKERVMKFLEYEESYRKRLFPNCIYQ
jgi:REP-associated tyrosine transposase